MIYNKVPDGISGTYIYSEVMILFEKSIIKKYKKLGFDIVCDASGFKNTYYVYSVATPEGRRFESFKEAKEFCDKLMTT